MQHRGEQDLPAIPASHAFDCIYLHQWTWLPENFFHRASLKWWGKKEHQCPAAGTTVFQNDGGSITPHLAVPGLMWRLVFFSLLLPVSEKEQKITKASRLSAPFTSPFLIRAFPSKGEEENGTLSGTRLWHLGTCCLPVVTLSLNPFYQNGKSWSNKHYGHFRHILLLLAMSYHLE